MSDSADPADVTNSLRGHKAAISNPNVSKEAKEHSRQVIEQLEGKESTGSTGSGGSSGGSHSKAHQTSSSGDTTVDGKDAGNVARGLKAAMHNPNVSDEAKQAAEEKLKNLEG